MLQIQPLPTPAPMVWNDEARRCEGVVTGVGYEFLTSYVGPRDNMQAKLDVARVGYHTATWALPDEAAMLADPQAARTYHLRSTVKFVAATQAVRD